MFATRPLDVRDRALLEVATLGNVNWSGERFSLSDVRRDPSFAHYTRLRPERGDVGFVAEAAGRPIGVVWALHLPADDRGYGFVSTAVPELSVWVEESHRGTGVGRDLIRRLLRDAARRGVPGVSLSVEEGNRAKRLYRGEGFVDLPGREADGVMLWTADRGPGGATA